MGTTTRSSSHALNDGIDALSELPAEAMDAIRELMKEVRDETLELMQTGREQAEAIGEAAGTAVANHPYRSICIAIGVGCVLGMMISRR